MLETLAYDTADGFLFSLADGHAPRIRGYAFIVGSEPGFGGTVDIHEVVQTVRSRRNALQVAKHFEFDTRTGLLRRVRYQTLRRGQPVRVEVEYSDYVAVNSQPLAKRVLRREGTGVILDLTITSAETQPMQNDNAFAGQ